MVVFHGPDCTLLEALEARRASGLIDLVRDFLHETSVQLRRFRTPRSLAARRISIVSRLYVEVVDLQHGESVTGWGGVV